MFRSELFDAVIAEDRDLVSELLDRNPEWDREKNAKGETIAHVCSCAMAYYLMRHGKFHDLPDNDGITVSEKRKTDAKFIKLLRLNNRLGGQSLFG